MHSPAERAYTKPARSQQFAEIFAGTAECPHDPFDRIASCRTRLRVQRLFGGDRPRVLRCLHKQAQQLRTQHLRAAFAQSGRIIDEDGSFRFVQICQCICLLPLLRLQAFLL